MRKNFIMVHLPDACTHCCVQIVSGNHWDCKQCENFQLCDNFRCYETEKKFEDRERHPFNQKDKLTLHQVNHCQYNTLKRAKHSSMMVPYHLHNPTATAFVTTCNICYLDIEAGQSWRCEVCADYDVCNACYQKDDGIDHPHKLNNHPSLADRDAQNKEARQLRVLQIKKMLELLLHASQCRCPHCPYPDCRKVTGLFRHGIQCKIQVSGGCVLCKKMWYLLHFHACACKESACVVPRCRDFKEKFVEDAAADCLSAESCCHEDNELSETTEEDFVMAHSQDACSHCSVLMASGNCFECKHFKRFQFGDKCFDTEQKLEDGESHPINKKDNHILYPSETKEVVPRDTKDEDEILESESVDINLDLKLKKMIVHASHCRFPHCPYPNCRKVKGLFRHGRQCKIQVSGGCVVCKNMWYLLQFHARACKESACVVPRCRDLKEHLQQFDFPRRDTVRRMEKERAKDFASGS